MDHVADYLRAGLSHPIWETHGYVGFITHAMTVDAAAFPDQTILNDAIRPGDELLLGGDETLTINADGTLNRPSARKHDVGDTIFRRIP